MIKISSRILDYIQPERLCEESYKIQRGFYDIFFMKGNNPGIKLEVRNYDDQIVSSKKYNLTFKDAIKYLYMIPSAIEKNLKQKYHVYEYVRYFYDKLKLIKTISVIEGKDSRTTNETKYEYNNLNIAFIESIIDSEDKNHRFKKTIYRTEFVSENNETVIRKFLIERALNEDIVVVETKRLIDMKSIYSINTPHGVINQVTNYLLCDPGVDKYNEYNLEVETDEIDGSITIDSSNEKIIVSEKSKLNLDGYGRSVNCIHKRTYNVTRQEIEELVMGE